MRPACTVLLAVVISGSTDAAVAFQQCLPDWTVFASGLTNPRHIRVGPDGHLYVAEAGVGGGQLQTCDWPGNMFTVPGPYMGGFSARISRILPNGHRETVADGLPSFLDGFGDGLGATDIAWIDGTMYALVEGGGCTRGLPDHPAGIVRIHSNGTYSYVADITSFIRAHPVSHEPFCGPDGDCEPDGVPHSMIADGRRLLVVETNHSSVLEVDPRTGAIARLYDLSAEDPAPTVLTRHGNRYYLGGFAGLIHTFDRKREPIAVAGSGFGPIVELSTIRGRLHVLETFHAATPWTPETGRVLRVEPHGGTSVVACGLDFPIGMAAKGRNIFVSTKSYGQGPAEGMGQIVRIDLRP